MNRVRRRETGAILVMTAIIVVLLLGFGAFALDLGRVYLQRTEMQNAVDAAARAGAIELDGQSGALNRAKAAVADLLDHEAHFAKDRELLGTKLATHYIDTPNTDPNSANYYKKSTISFYSWINSGDDVDYDDPGQECADIGGEWASEERKCITTEDVHAHYVEVRLDPELVDDPDTYTIDLFFLPVLEILTDNVARIASLKAEAVAGRHFLVCNYPPVMFCNPFESIGETFAEAVNPDRTGGPLLEPGDSLVLKYQSGSWAPGNFAFLLPRDDDGNFQTGARDLGEYIANPNQQGCSPPEVRTRTGSVQSWPIWGWNTRFDFYKSFDEYDYPPAPNVMEYPQDQGFDVIGGLTDRFGNGVWSAADYWDEFHSYHSSYASAPSKPASWDSMTRWQAYNWEINNGYPACDPNGPDNEDDGGFPNDDDVACPEESDLPNVVKEGDSDFKQPYADPWPTPEPDREVIYTEPADAAQRSLARPIIEGLPQLEHLSFIPDLPSIDEPPESVAERRVLFTAVIDCQAQNISGSKDAIAGTFAKFFIIQTATQGASATDYVTEYMGLATEQDEEYHVEVQLYE